MSSIIAGPAWPRVARETWLRRNGTGAARRRRVVICSWRDETHPEAGGSERYVGQVARYLASQGDDVVVLTSDHGGAPRDEVADGVRYRRRGGRLSVFARAADTCPRRTTSSSMSRTASRSPPGWSPARRSSSWCTTSTASSGPWPCARSRPRSAGSSSPGWRRGCCGGAPRRRLLRHRAGAGQSGGASRGCRGRPQRAGRPARSVAPRRPADAVRRGPAGPAQARRACDRGGVAAGRGVRPPAARLSATGCSDERRRLAHAAGLDDRIHLHGYLDEWPSTG